MTDQLGQEIIAELRAIRALLSTKPAAPAAASAPAPAGAPKDIPQPSEIVDDPGSIEVHFGKNSGKPLRSLGAKSVEWYAQEPEPRIGNNGKPFPLRAEDVRLRNAARQIVHGNRGTLAAGSKVTLVTETLTEEVPF
jgi:broad specificity phosphatase PhoE